MGHGTTGFPRRSTWCRRRAGWAQSRGCRRGRPPRPCSPAGPALPATRAAPPLRPLPSARSTCSVSRMTVSDIASGLPVACHLEMSSAGDRSTSAMRLRSNRRVNSFGMGPDHDAFDSDDGVSCLIKSRKAAQYYAEFGRGRTSSACQHVLSSAIGVTQVQCAATCDSNRFNAWSPVRGEVVDEGLVGDIELPWAAPTMDDPFVAHNRSAGVYPEGRQLPLGIHPPPSQRCQIKLPHLHHARRRHLLLTRISLGCE